MSQVQRATSERSLERQLTLTPRPQDFTQRQGETKQHPVSSLSYPSRNIAKTSQLLEVDVPNILDGQAQHIRNLQNTVSNLLDRNKFLIDRLGDKIEESDSLRLKVSSANQELQRTLDKMSVISDTMDDLRDEISELRLLQVPRATPRTIIVSKLLDYSTQNPRCPDGDGTHTVSESIDRRLTTNLKGTLDTLLSTDETRCLCSTFERWFGTDMLQTIALVTCCVCRKHKFKQYLGVAFAAPVDEFLTVFPRSGCTSPVCSECYLKAVSYSLDRLQESCWTNKGPTISISCPCGCAGNGNSINDRGFLIQLLRHLGDEKLEIQKLRTYDMALQVMRILDSINPPLARNARDLAARIHRKMVVNGLMYSPFDLKIRDLDYDETGFPLAPNYQLVQLHNIEYAGETLRVPILTRLLRVEKTPTECVVCTDSIYDVCYGHIDQWIKVCVEFDGDWMWKLLLFPQKLATKCDHIIDFCTSCLQQHIQVQLETFARGACENILCPSQGCKRVLTYEEMQIYAEEETFSKYDEYLKIEALTKMPSFMWCLSDNCSNGQIHDLILDSHVACAECEFEMCFNHQMKWHDNLTCEQYDSLKETGDPDYQETQKWVATNTKQCPGCGINIQKDEGCLHMTCKF
ncbi:hypothetical protein IWW34DRAFT_725940 [Fusarium oxysporum f. sp. albedinis]|nr:hypothetical protein IWW34DRAFT_725940 [Fusarium oxysporum f. sp. albedinis]